MENFTCSICGYEWKGEQNGEHLCSNNLLQIISELKAEKHAEEQRKRLNNKITNGLTDMIMQRIDDLSVDEVLQCLIADTELEEVVMCIDMIARQTGFIVDLRKKIGKKNNTKKLTAKYRHYKTNELYTIICYAVSTSDSELCVVYENEKGKKYIREESEFYGSILVEKEVTVSKRVPAPRFEKILE